MKETTEGEALNTRGASSSPTPLHLPASSTASSCTISLAEVHLLRKRRRNEIQDPAERIFCHLVIQQKYKVMNFPMKQCSVLLERTKTQAT